MQAKERVQAAWLSAAWALALGALLTVVAILEPPLDAGGCLVLFCNGLLVVTGIGLSVRVARIELVAPTAWFIGVVEGFYLSGLVIALGLAMQDGPASGLAILLVVGVSLLRLSLAIGALRLLCREGAIE